MIDDYTTVTDVEDNLGNFCRTGRFSDMEFEYFVSEKLRNVASNAKLLDLMAVRLRRSEGVRSCLRLVICGAGRIPRVVILPEVESIVQISSSLGTLQIGLEISYNPLG